MVIAVSILKYYYFYFSPSILFFTANPKPLAVAPAGFVDVLDLVSALVELNKDNHGSLDFERFRNMPVGDAVGRKITHHTPTLSCIYRYK